MELTVGFPTRENKYVQNYLKILNENNRSQKDFMALLYAVEELERMLTQSNKNVADMHKQLSELKEIQKHPIKTELYNISQAIKENADAAKSQLDELKESIVNACKKAVENFKDVGASALDKTVSFLRLKGSLEAVSGFAAKNNGLCDKAIGKIETFFKEFHKSGRALKNMWRIMLGKEPVDTAAENGKLAQALIEPYRKGKAVWTIIEQKSYVTARELSDFQTRTLVKRIDKQDTKESKRSENTQKSNIFAKVEKHKKTVEANKNDKTQEKKNVRDAR